MGNRHFNEHRISTHFPMESFAHNFGIVPFELNACKNERNMYDMRRQKEATWATR